MVLLKKTKSVCPEDLRVIDAELHVVDGKVMMRKSCPQHGDFEDVCWSDYEEYKRAERFRDHGSGLHRTLPVRLGCPNDCGLCNNHKTHTTLLIMELTQRCNLRCPICYAQAGENNLSGDLSKEQIRQILEYAQSNNYPLRVRGVGNSGGEVTLRDDLPEIIRMEKDLGYDYILIMSNGLRIADDLEYFKEIRNLEAWIYLQFDGVTSEPYIAARGRNLWPLKQRIIENARKIGYNKIALIPTLVKGLNDHQVGDIIRYAADNLDVIKFVVFQPVSFSGRIDKSRLKEMRLTISDVMRLSEDQTGGKVGKKDYFTLPMNQTLARIITKGGLNQDFCVHPHCGVIALVGKENGNLLSIPRFIKNEDFHDSIQRGFDEGWSRARMMMSLLICLLKYVSPRLWLKLARILLAPGDKSTVKTTLTKRLTESWLTIGIMHFMDPYNFDLDRVENCALHFGVIGKESKPRLIPFCSMNSIHRSSIAKESCADKMILQPLGGSRQ